MFFGNTVKSPIQCAQFWPKTMSAWERIAYYIHEEVLVLLWTRYPHSLWSLQMIK